MTRYSCLPAWLALFVLLASCGGGSSHSQEPFIPTRIELHHNYDLP
ncbi:hypothetical protein [Alcanivorax sp. 1008]|nr:hypothetical protein [Alcanivorax sp. 1008]